MATVYTVLELNVAHNMFVFKDRDKHYFELSSITKKNLPSKSIDSNF